MKPTFTVSKQYPGQAATVLATFDNADDAIDFLEDWTVGDGMAVDPNPHNAIAAANTDDGAFWYVA